MSEFSQTLDLKVGGSVELEGDHQVIIKSSLIIVSLKRWLSTCENYKIFSYLQNCCADDKDYVELGGSSSLDSRRLKTKDTFCGCDRRRMRSRGLTVLCESSTVRLVSSGQHRNSVTVFARAAGAEDLVSSNILNNLFYSGGDGVFKIRFMQEEMALGDGSGSDFLFCPEFL